MSLRGRGVNSDIRVHILLLHKCFPNMTCTNLMPKSESYINNLSLNFLNCQAGAFQKNIIKNMSWKGFSLSLQVFDLWLCLCQLVRDPGRFDPLSLRYSLQNGTFSCFLWRQCTLRWDVNLSWRHKRKPGTVYPININYWGNPVR